MTTHILILCTHNSARSVLAEGMLNHLARQQGLDVRAHSAGSTPSGRINPHALAALANAGVDTAGYRSKSWDEFAASDAPCLRIVITVCDSAAAETCPLFVGQGRPGGPVRVHWGHADPSKAPAAVQPQAFEATRLALAQRMQGLLGLPLATMGDAELRTALNALAADTDR